MITIHVYRMQLQGEGLQPFIRGDSDVIREAWDLVTLSWSSCHPSVMDNGGWQEGDYTGTLYGHIGHWFDPEIIGELYDRGFTMVEVCVDTAHLTCDITGQVSFPPHAVKSIAPVARETAMGYAGILLMSDPYSTIYEIDSDARRRRIRGHIEYEACYFSPLTYQTSTMLKLEYRSTYV